MDRKSVSGEYKNRLRSPERLRDCLGGTDKLQQRMGEIFALKRLWCSIMGERISLISSPYRINDGVLSVAVHDSMWIAELPYIKGDMLTKLADAGLELTDIRFTLSKVPPPAQPKMLKTPPVPVEQQKWAERMSTAITDDAAREAYLQALLANIWRMPK